MRFVQLANHFGRDYRHLIVSMNGNVDALGLLSDDLDVRLLEVPTERGKTLPNLRTYRRMLRDLRPNLLVTSNWGSIEWALANWGGLSPHLHMEDGFGPEEVARQLPRRVWTRRLALHRSTVMLPSTTLYEIARNLWRLPKRSLRQIPNGVDCARFGGKPDMTFARRYNLVTDRPVIGTVAALRAEKNLNRLIEAFALANRQQAAILAIVGDGVEMPALKQRAMELGVSDAVIFTGACPTPERLLPSFTIFALSSDTEQMPISILEAMAAGLPVAATDVGDVRRMVAEDNRPFVVGKDTAALADALSALMAAPSRAAAIGAANARRARETFDQSLMFAAYDSLYSGDGL